MDRTSDPRTYFYTKANRHNDFARDYAFWVESADFFKLRSVSLTVDLPARFLYLGAKTGSVVFAARNV